MQLFMLFLADNIINIHGKVNPRHCMDLCVATTPCTIMEYFKSNSICLLIVTKSFEHK